MAERRRMTFHTDILWKTNRMTGDDGYFRKSGDTFKRKNFVEVQYFWFRMTFRATGRLRAPRGAVFLPAAPKDVESCPVTDAHG
jgi:hypothetical protein